MSFESMYAALSVGARGAAGCGLPACAAWAPAIWLKLTTAMTAAAVIAIVRMCFTPLRRPASRWLREIRRTAPPRRDEFTPAGRVGVRNSAELPASASPIAAACQGSGQETCTLDPIRRWDA